MLHASPHYDFLNVSIEAACLLLGIDGIGQVDGRPVQRRLSNSVQDFELRGEGICSVQKCEQLASHATGMCMLSQYAHRLLYEDLGGGTIADDAARQGQGIITLDECDPLGWQEFTLELTRHMVVVKSLELLCLRYEDGNAIR